MDKCREEFEKTRTFKSIYSTLMYFEESLDLYTTKEKWREEDAWRLTYAWWAYKELQTRIDSKREATKGGFSQWFKTTNYFGAYFTDLDLALNHRDQFENDIINSAWLAHQSRQTEVDELQKRVGDLELFLKRIHRYGLDSYNTSTRLTIRDELEQALKGDQYDEHRKKAEEAISKGASLTNHRIEL
ncbi:hypothetical protein ABTF33_09700 [Acinetobacter baumannii]